MLNQQGKKVKNNNKEINVDLNKKLVRFITDRIQTLQDKELKNTQKKQKSGIYNGYHGLLSQGWIDGRY